MFIRKEHSQVRKYILNDIEYSKKKGVNIDITHVDRFARGNVMIPLDRDMSGYYSVVIDGVTVYDKSGQNLKKYGFSNNPKRTGTTIATVERTGTDDYYVYSDTEDLLQIDLTRDTDLNAVEARIQEYHKKLIIFCKHIYISPLTVPINADEFVLVNPIITDEFLHSIDCSKVTIETDGYHPSYKALNCTEFSLTYNGDAYYNDNAYEYTPEMPGNANTVKVEIRAAIYHDILFIGTENIQKLTLRYARVERDMYDTLDGRSDLIDIISNFRYEDEGTRLETINVDALNYLSINTGTFVPTAVLYNLETLLVPGMSEVGFKIRKEMSSIYPRGPSTIKHPFERLTTFSGYLTDNNILKKMPNLKILYGIGSIKEDEIPPSLEEYYTQYGQDYRYWNLRINEMVNISKYLMTMPTIKRMPLYLSNDDYQYPIGRRNDVYYDIYLPVMDRIHKWNDIRQVLPEQIDDFLEDIPQLREALIANRRYMTRTGTLASLLK